MNHMDNAIIRKRAMKWLQRLGVKGIKVDFFGGDKQETMRLYEDILSDADVLSHMSSSVRKIIHMAGLHQLVEEI